MNAKRVLVSLLWALCLALPACDAGEFEPDDASAPDAGDAAPGVVDAALLTIDAEWCDANTPCPGGLLCNLNSGQCATTCTVNTSDQCHDVNDYCVDGTRCATRLPQGAICSDGRQCFTGQCSDGFCCDSVCSGTCDS